MAAILLTVPQLITLTTDIESSICIPARRLYRAGCRYPREEPTRVRATELPLPGLLTVKVFGIFVLSFLDRILTVVAAHPFFEVANGFTQAAADLRQLAGSKDDQRDCQNDQKLLHTQSEHKPS